MEMETKQHNLSHNVHDYNIDVIIKQNQPIFFLQIFSEMKSSFNLSALPIQIRIEQKQNKNTMLDLEQKQIPSMTEC
jgi:hypothetical protein